MTTLRQQLDKAVIYATNVLRNNPRRYNFNSVDVPPTKRACGCLWGLIGEGLGAKPGAGIHDVYLHFDLSGPELYAAMRKAGAPEGRADDWHDHAGTAAKFLKKAAVILKRHIPRGKRA